MKIIKVLLVLVLILIIALVVVGAVAMANIDRAAKVAIQRGGNHALGVNTTLASADIGVFSGTFSMDDLTVANPEGFDTPHFLALDGGGVSVSYASLLEDTIILPEFTLSGIDINLDKEEGGSNYQRILDNLKRFQSGDAPSEPNQQGTPKKLVIRKLQIDDITVHADLVGNSPVTVNVDKVLLTNVGSEGGDTLEIAGVVAVVVEAVMRAVIEAGAGQIPGAILNELQNSVAQLDAIAELGVGVAAEIDGRVQELNALAEDLQQGVDDARKNLEEEADKIGEQIDNAGKDLEEAAKGIGNLLGGEKKEDGPKEDDPND